MRTLLITLAALLPLLFSTIATDCSGNPVQPPPPPPPAEPDSTTQNFTFQTYEFGGGGESSWLNDVWIFNGNNIWAVGYITPDDTTNSKYHVANPNILKWNGAEWIVQPYSGSSGGMYGIWAADSEDIYFAIGTVVKYDHGFYKEFNLGNLGFTNGQGVHKLWGSSTSNIWGVGPWGTIVHYDGNNWTKIDFDQQWYFYGITGNLQTGVAYASAQTSGGTVLVVALENNSAKIIYNNQDSFIFNSYFIHFQNAKLWLAGNYIWTIDIKSNVVKQEAYLGGYGIGAIASTSAIDMYYFGGEVPDISRMVHFNGKRYKAFTLTPLSDSYGGGYAIKDLAARCGSANNKAFITLIRRN